MCSGPFARICAVACFEYMTTNPMVAARNRQCVSGLNRADFMQEWEMCTHFTSPYQLKWARSKSAEAKPSLLMSRAMNTFDGTSSCNDCSCDFMVSGDIIMGVCHGCFGYEACALDTAHLDCQHFFCDEFCFPPRLSKGASPVPANNSF